MAVLCELYVLAVMAGLNAQSTTFSTHHATHHTTHHTTHQYNTPYNTFYIYNTRYVQTVLYL